MNETLVRDRVVVIGMGRTGLSCARYFTRLGEPPVVVDTRPNPPGLATLRSEMPTVAVYTGDLKPGALVGARELVVSPGVPVAHPAIRTAAECAVPVIGDIELFARAADAPVIAITGSNGKSTVTALVAAMLREAGLEVAAGGNFGTPALDLLSDPRPDWYVLELSSFQLETTYSLNAAAAALLNLSPDHLDRYASFAAYVDAKRRVFQGSGAMVLNLDDRSLAALAEPGRLVSGFTSGEPGPQACGVLRVAGQDWLSLGQKPIIAVNDVALSGRHNRLNALAAMALARVAEVPGAAMARVLGRFSGLPHRCQTVAIIDDVRYVNDSKGTNVGAAVAAIEGLTPARGRLVLIAGGDCKGANFSDLAAALPGRVRTLILLGRDAPDIAEAVGDSVPSVAAGDMAQAVRLAHHHAEPGDVVLLSPACASFDMYNDYGERGEHFATLVEAL